MSIANDTSAMGSEAIGGASDSEGRCGSAMGSRTLPGASLDAARGFVVLDCCSRLFSDTRGFFAVARPGAVEPGCLTKAGRADLRAVTSALP